jgi:DNA-binding GntR family transcriptional regulator
MKDIVKTTLAEQIYSILKEDIINQNIKCGEKLTIKELQERFNVSSTPVRDAMGRLNQDGLIDHVTNVGAKIILLEEKDISEIYDFCSILDDAALKLSMESAKVDEFISEITKCIAHQEKAIESNNIKGFKQHSDDFHDCFFRYADNSRLYSAATKMRSQLSILTNKYQNLTIAKSVVFIEHKQIADAIANKDYDNSSLFLKNHFEHEKNYLLENLTNNDIF